MFVGVLVATYVGVMVARNNQCQLETKAIVAEHHDKMTERLGEIDRILEGMKTYQQDPNRIHTVRVEQDPQNPVPVQAMMRRRDDPKPEE